MKKILLFASALAGLFLAGSCQKETLEPAAQGGVTYEITLPDGPQTKGEDGYATYDLHYEVYKTADANALASTPLLFEKTVTMEGNTTTVTLDLLNDQDYTILFWANKQGENYFDLTDLRQVGVRQAASNNDDRDAFCGMDQLVQHDGAQSKTVELKRPFAQINIATLVPTVAEIGYDVTPLSSLVKVKNIPVKYNVFTGEPVGDAVEVDYTVNLIPEGNLTVNTTDYKKVAMNYALVPATQDNSATVEVYYEINTVNGTVKNSIPNVPVKKNYRTNIIGNLLTSNATYNIVLLPGFEDDNSGDVEVINEGIVKFLNTGVYQISSAKGLAYASQNLFAEGGSFVLATDIDMSEYTAFETKAGDKFWKSVLIDHKTFTFDGKGYSISNLPGMFVRYTVWGDLTIKNLTLNNPKIAYDLDDKNNAGVGAFFGYSDASNKILLENCHIKGGEIAGAHFTGGLIGYTAGWEDESTLIIKNCSVKDATVTGKGSCGGIIGHANGGKGLVEMNTISVFSNTIKSTGTDTNKAGSVMGTVGSSTVKVTNCSVIDNEVTSNGVSNTKLWGRQGSSTGVLYVDGVQVDDFGTFTPSTTVTVTNDAELAKAIEVKDVKTIKLAAGTYSNIALTVAENGDFQRDIKFEAVEGEAPVIAGTVTLGYRNQGVGAAMWDGDVTFEGITFDHAETAKHSISVGDVKSLTLKNCTIIGDGEYGIDSARGNGTGTSKIEGCTFVNSAMQLLGNLATGLVIDNCTFNESRINVQAGNGVTVQNCTFNSTLKSVHIGDSFYCVRSNSTPITVKNSTINIDSELAEVATAQSKWYLLANRGTTNWTVENVAVTLSDAALMQTELDVTACTSTGVINTTNLTVNGNVYASTTAQLTDAIKNGATLVALKDGNYELPTGSTVNLKGKELTLVGSENVVIDVTKVDTRDQFVTGATLTFEGVTLNFGKVNYMGFANTASLTYKNCNINGLQFLIRNNVVFEGCSLNSNGAEHSVWTYSAKNISFTDCDFTYGDRAINCYSDNDVDGGKQTVNFTDCTFATSNTASEGAVEINSCFLSIGIEVNMEGCTAPAYGQMAYVSPWDSTNGAKTTINIK